MKRNFSPSVPRIEALHIQNYRVLRDLRLRNLAPLTVFLGPNGSGKSTLFDVFAFLSDAFSVGLRKAIDRRGRFKELRTRGQEGPITIELKYRERTGSPLITYHLSIDERRGRPYVVEEWLQWRRKSQGRPFRFLDFKEGKGSVVTGDMPDEEDERIEEHLDSPEVLAVNALGQLAKHPRIGALRRFITSWYLSYISANSARSIPEAGPQEHLSETGDNLPNVIQYLKEEHPERLREILQKLSQRVPRLESVDAQFLQDGRLLLQIKDAPFDEPIMARYASDGTLKMLAYLVLLYDPAPPQLIGIEEPENHLYPHILRELAEECRQASRHTQILISTHSPFFVNGLEPEEVWLLQRDEQGFTQARRAADIDGVREFIRAGSLLGYLWTEGYLEPIGLPVADSPVMMHR